MDKPTKQSLWFCERWINVRAIARAQGMSPAYVTYIINGDRRNLNALLRVGSAIGVSIDELLEGIEVRKREKLEQANTVIRSYSSRVMAEDAENEARKKAGRPPLLILPGLRISNT